jgi:hypothetical protein
MKEEKKSCESGNARGSETRNAHRTQLATATPASPTIMQCLLCHQRIMCCSHGCSCRYRRRRRRSHVWCLFFLVRVLRSQRKLQHHTHKTQLKHTKKTQLLHALSSCDWLPRFITRLSIFIQAFHWCWPWVHGDAEQSTGVALSITKTTPPHKNRTPKKRTDTLFFLLVTKVAGATSVSLRFLRFFVLNTIATQGWHLRRTWVIWTA